MLVAAAAIGGCASSRPPAEPAPPSDPTVASLAAWLKLDPAQQERTGELIRQLSERNAAIYASWSRGDRVRPQALLESRSVFERDFLAILTPPQREQIAKSSVLLATRGRGAR